MIWHCRLSAGLCHSRERRNPAILKYSDTEGLERTRQPQCPPGGSGKQGLPMVSATMAREIDISSYKCDCGYEANFFENTIREMKCMSLKKRARLVEEDHAIVVDKGKAVEMICPQKGRCPIK